MSIAFYLLGYFTAVIAFLLGTAFGYRIGVGECELDDTCVKGND